MELSVPPSPVPRHPDHSVSHHLPCPEPAVLLAASQPLKPVAAQPSCSCFLFLSGLTHSNRLNNPPALTRSLHLPLHLPTDLKPPDPSSPPPLLPFAPSNLPLTAVPENNHLSTACLIYSVFTHSTLQSWKPRQCFFNVFMLRQTKLHLSGSSRHYNPSENRRRPSIGLSTTCGNLISSPERASGCQSSRSSIIEALSLPVRQPWLSLR